MAVARFEVIGELGEGGMGRVCLARRELLLGVTQRVVVKRPLPIPEARARVRDEARAMARVFHGNVAQLLDAGEDDEGPYLVMEHVDGVDLHAVLDDARAHPVTVVEVAWIVHEAARGAAAVHDARDDDGAPLGLVHRDLSPQNLLASRRGEVKVTDFGIAWAPRREDRTATGVVVGNPRYISPEQLEGRHAGAATDVFGLGRVLEELIAVSDPCEALRTVAERATRRVPSERHGDAASFADAVRAAVPELAAGRALLGARVARVADARARVRDGLRAMLGEVDDETALPRAPTEAAPRVEAPAPQGSAHATGAPRRRAVVVSAMALALLAAAGIATAWRPARTAPRAAVVLERAASAPSTVAPTVAPVPPRAAPEASRVAPAPASPPPRSPPRGRVHAASPTTPPQPAVARDAGAWATLRVNAIPWAEVSIDGAAPEHTPHAFVVAAGEHRVTARFADGSELVEAVRLAPGEDRRLGLQRR